MSSFASDNYAPMHPAVLAALTEANARHVPAYGGDTWTARLQEVTTAVFGPGATILPVLTGTGANVVSLMHLAPRWGGVVAARGAHINGDENGAPERIGGLKILPVDAPDGRLTTSDVATYLPDLGDAHRAQPCTVSVTQSTELGTVYSPEALRSIADAAHGAGLSVHMDGSRLANAAAFIGCGLGDLTASVGVDALSLGGTKNGAMLGEAVVLFTPDAGDAAYLRKMTMQSASKQRYVAAQLVALLRDRDDGDPLWLRNARHANAMAARLRAGVEDVTGVEVTQPTESNAVFARLPHRAADALRDEYGFYDWAPAPDPAMVEVRWMCSWDTAPTAVDRFVAAIRTAVSRSMKR